MFRPVWIAWLLLALALALPACGGDDDDDDDDDDVVAGEGEGEEGEGEGEPSCVADPGDVDLTGVWGVQASVQARLTERPESIVHLCPDGTALATATIYLRLEVTAQEGGQLEQTTSVCELQLPAAPGAVAPCEEEPEPMTISIGMGAELATFLPTLEFPAQAALDVVDGCVQYQPDDLVLILGTNFAAGDRDTALPFWDPTCSTSSEECVAEYGSVDDQ